MLNFSPLFTETCSKEFGIRPNHVIEAMKHKDKIEIIRVNGLELRIYMKKILTRIQSYLIIIERVIKDNDTLIDFAMKAYPDLFDALEEKTPLQIIELTANKYGVYMQIGSVRSKFILQQKIPITNTSNIVVIEDQNKKNIIQQLYLKIENGEKLIANCAICYCLDKTAYTEWINGGEMGPLHNRF